jgi:hypothetical protein
MHFRALQQLPPKPARCTVQFVILLHHNQGVWGTCQVHPQGFRHCCQALGLLRCCVVHTIVHLVHMWQSRQAGITCDALIPGWSGQFTVADSYHELDAVPAAAEPLRCCRPHQVDGMRNTLRLPGQLIALQLGGAYVSLPAARQLVIWLTPCRRDYSGAHTL